MWLLLLLHAFFAATYTLGKSSLLYASPIFAVSVRLVGCGLLLLVLLWFRGLSFRVDRRDLGIFAIFSFFLFYSYVPDYMVLPYMSSTKWALIYTLTPFCTALISYLYGSERLTWQKVIGLCIGFAGIVPVLIFGTNSESADDLYRFSWPEMVMMACMVSYSYGWVLANRLIREKKYNAALVNGIGMLLGGIGGFCTLPLVEGLRHNPVHAWWPFVGVMVPLILITVFVFTVNTHLLKYYTVTFLMFIAFVDPLYVALYGWLFLKEHVGPYFFLSSFMLFLGLFIFYREELKQHRIA